MTLKVVVSIPLLGNVEQGHEARVDMIGTMGPAGAGPHAEYVRPGEEKEFYIHSGMNLRVSEVRAGSADDAEHAAKAGKPSVR